MEFMNLRSGEAFSMGKGRNWRIIHPDMGAEWITLNHGLHGAGNEFVQHVHDESDDIIVVLTGSVSLRQGERYTKALAGEAIWIQAGEVHGTLNDSGGEVKMVSFQSPPDRALYRGDRNKEERERPRPRSDHASSVLVVRMSSGGADFRQVCDWRRVFSPANGSRRMILEYGELSAGQSIEIEKEPYEGLVIVLEGDAHFTVAGKAQAAQHRLSAEDLVFFRTGEGGRFDCLRGSATLLHCASLGLEGGNP